jgi:hypothetical protein
VVRVNENARQDIHMEVGAVATKVEASAQPALVNTYTSELSETIDWRRVLDLPLNARDVTSLAMLVAGVNDPVGQTTFYASASGFTGTSPAVNGGRNQDNSYFLDGTDNLYTITRSGNLFPNPDAVQKFTINTFQYSAEFGGRPGGQLSVRTKSGTNMIHATVFEFVRNSVFNLTRATGRIRKVSMTASNAISMDGLWVVRSIFPSFLMEGTSCSGSIPTRGFRSVLWAGPELHRVLRRFKNRATSVSPSREGPRPWLFLLATERRKLWTRV